jgi:chorismate synthase
LARRGIQVSAHIRSIGAVEDRPFDPMGETEATFDALRSAPFPVLEEKAGELMRKTILEARDQLDSVGGVVECMVTGLPAGVGDPMFGGMEGRMAAGLFGIPAAKGVEFGDGFGVACRRGSQNNDPYLITDGKITTKTNHAGGILGGITNGMPLLFRVAFKPTPSIAKEQDSVSLSRGQAEKLVITGRHDPCIVPRAVPVVEAVAAITLLDALLDSPAVLNGNAKI